ncbi:MAG: histidinol dehydrogenase [Caldilineaceae bacterium]|nr:histidinol dehydrogenase [Caldilineaceae bacterium]
MDVATAEATILRRAAWDEWQVPDAMLDKNNALFGERIGPDEAVRRILADVRHRGDAALVEWTERLDRVKPQALVLTEKHIQDAYAQVSAALVEAMTLASERISHFHRGQPTLQWLQEGPEGLLGQLVRPIPRVGIYIPGGEAPLFSSLLMTAIPAKVAGVPEIVIISPPQRDSGLPHPTTIVAAAIAGVDAIYVGGGAQAIGALAFGTATVPRVDKVCGPGNIFTTLAKRQVFGIVGIDGLPGPTETLVIADESADPQLVAADLLAQAEHDILACAILLTPSQAMAERVQAAVASQLEELGRAEVIVQSLERGSGIVVTETLAQSVALANQYAPEHLCLLVDQPEQYLEQIHNAGGIFLGERSFEVLGDYVAGPSHVMPTGGTARFTSPINVNDFLKLISVIGLNEEAFAQIGVAAERMANAEGLTAHAAAVSRRLGRQG